MGSMFSGSVIIPVESKWGWHLCQTRHFCIFISHGKVGSGVGCIFRRVTCWGCVKEMPEIIRLPDAKLSCRQMVGCNPSCPKDSGQHWSNTCCQHAPEPSASIRSARACDGFSVSQVAVGNLRNVWTSTSKSYPPQPS